MADCVFHHQKLQSNHFDRHQTWRDQKLAWNSSHPHVFAVACPQVDDAELFTHIKPHKRERILPRTDLDMVQVLLPLHRHLLPAEWAAGDELLLLPNGARTKSEHFQRDRRAVFPIHATNCCFDSFRNFCLPNTEWWSIVAIDGDTKVRLVQAERLDELFDDAKRAWIQQNLHGKHTSCRHRLYSLCSVNFSSRLYVPSSQERIFRRSGAWYRFNSCQILRRFYARTRHFRYARGKVSCSGWP